MRVPPTFVEPNGWDCVFLEPWHAEAVQAEGPRWTTQVQCTPPQPVVVDEWRCQRPGVIVDAQGFGTVQGTAECETSGVTCTAVVIGTGHCTASAAWSASPPLRCRASVTGAITQWHVTCYNDP